MPPMRDLAKRGHAIFMRAMDLDPPLRRAFVHDACAPDHELIQHVNGLLDASEQSEAFLDTPAIAPPHLSMESSPSVPDAVGTYLVVGVLGVGGMATVYEAIQEHPKRRVALKVLRKSMAHTDAYVRFLFETEALARLHHPGIAQIYEAGAAPLGADGPSPFFAMELIPDAMTITAHVERRRLSVRERVAMIAAVCDAVHHGHQHGVIHRDLKPGNVLVDGEGRPKVIDFGIARATEPTAQSLTESSDARQLIGTLNYMSPEQCGAEGDIDIRTDVYSLGVLLYELVCGHLPHHLAQLPLPAALHAIVHGSPRRASLSNSRSNRDLEAIMLKAIEKEPQRRYDSASSLAIDLRRWLNHQPIEARPPGVIDQFRLFAKRNRALVVGGVTIAASIAILAAVSTFFVVRLTDEVRLRRNAEQRSIDERDLARWQAYTAQIAGALAAMKSSEFHQMRNRLQTVSHPKRDWEWGFLSRVAEQSFSTVIAHEEMIQDLAVDPDWKRLATAANDGTVRLWKADDRTMLGSFTSETGARAVSVCFTLDGQHVVTGDDRGVIRLLDGATLSFITEIADLPTGIRDVVAMPDNRIAAAAANGTAFIWSLDSKESIALPSDQPGGIHGLELSRDAHWLATFNAEGELWVRRADEFSVVHRMQFASPGDAIYQARFSSDGRLIGAAGSNSNLMVWDLSNEGQLLSEFRATGGVNTVRSLAFSNNGDMIAAGLTHRLIVVRSLRDGSVIGELGGHHEAVSGIFFQPGDEVLISASWDRTIRAWRTEEFASRGWVTLANHPREVRKAEFSPDGAIIASVSLDGTLLLSEPNTATPIARLRTDEPMEIRDIAWSPDGLHIAAACEDRIVRIWSTTTGRIESELAGHTRYVASVAFSACGTRIAAGGADGRSLVWDWKTSGTPLMLQGHEARVNSIAFSPDGLTIATGSRDRSVRLWNALTGEVRFVLAEHESDVFDVLFDHDGTRLFTGSRDQSIRIWNVETGSLIQSLSGSGQFITSLAFNAGGTRLIAGSWYGDVLHYDVETLDLIASFRAHDAAVRSVAFSPDNRWLATASNDGSVRLFDSATREQSDAAKRVAREAAETMKRRVGPLIEQSLGDPAVLMNLLEQAGFDPVRNPSARNAILAILSPVDAPP